MQVLLISLLILGGLGIVFGMILGIAGKLFHVKKDPLAEELRGQLPGANCGGCGFAGCDAFAEALAKGEAKVTGCAVANAGAVAKLCGLLGIQEEKHVKRVAHVHCRGTKDAVKLRARYYGIMDCKAAALAGGGIKECLYACMNLGSCEKTCPFGAIHTGENGVAVVDEEKCTGCGACARACPHQIITVEPADQPVSLACSNRDVGKKVSQVCINGCLGCTLCAKTCPHGAIVMQNNLPVIDYEKCVGCGACTQKCKPGALKKMGIAIEK